MFSDKMFPVIQLIHTFMPDLIPELWMVSIVNVPISMTSVVEYCLLGIRVTSLEQLSVAEFSGE